MAEQYHRGRAVIAEQETVQCPHCSGEVALAGHHRSALVQGVAVLSYCAQCRRNLHLTRPRPNITLIRTTS